MIGDAIQPCHLHHPLNTPFESLFGYSIDPGIKTDVLHHCQIAVEGKGLGHVTDTFFNSLSRTTHIRSGDLPRSPSWGKDTGEHLDHRGLAGTVSSQQTKNFPLLNLEADLVHCPEWTEIPGQAICLYGCAILMG